MTTTDTTFPTDALRRAVRGTVHEPGDPGFAAAHAIFYRHLDAAPRVAVSAVTADDVAHAVTFATEHGLDVAGRSGGHSVAGHGTVADGLVIDLGGLDTIDVDVEGPTVTAGTGATAGAVTAAVGEHGLAVGFGDTGTVGIGGITTGGGVGFLSRAHGLTVDNVLAAQVVTADGRVHDVDADHEPDLFWAVRGGGGNVGIATRFTYRLHEVPQVVGGLMVLPATAEVVAEVVRTLLEAPDELGAIANVMPAPPMPFVPPELHGSLVVFALVGYAGTPEEAEPVLSRLRAVATPVADLVQPMPYAALFPADEGDFHPVATSTTGFARGFDAADAARVIDVLSARLADPGVQMAVVQLRPLGGAIARVPAEATAYAHREWPLMFNVAAIVGDTQHLEAQQQWVDALAADIAKGTPGAYVGFSLRDDAEQVRRIYPGDTYDRLAAVKRTHDPGNVFPRNHNVPPAAG
jgi:FAD/FMN-containing dehydrogenase